VSGKTSIEWTEVTWNPTTGCDRISPGCDNCYALTLAKRLKAMGQAKYQNDGDPRTSGPGFGTAWHESALLEPLGWRAPRMVFVNSMSDIGHARFSDVMVASVFAVMALCPQHTFQVLTKRPKRLRRLLSTARFWDQVDHEIARVTGLNGKPVPVPAGTIPDPDGSRSLPNVWLGTSIESDEYCWRADELRTTPAGTRFLSLEPLLGPLPSLDLAGLDWVIVGGESGPRYRPMDLEWVRSLQVRCEAAQVAFFLKQIGGRSPKAGGRLLDGRTWDEFPLMPVGAR
jgi:protein gp37